MITFRTDLFGVDWDALKQDLIDDDFHNGRTTRQLQLSFENSASVVMAVADQHCIGNARLLSEGSATRSWSMYGPVAAIASRASRRS
jgi:hypothetical protein